MRYYIWQTLIADDGRTDEVWLPIHRWWDAWTTFVQFCGTSLVGDSSLTFNTTLTDLPCFWYVALPAQPPARRSPGARRSRHQAGRVAHPVVDVPDLGRDHLGRVADSESRGPVQARGPFVPNWTPSLAFGLATVQDRSADCQRGLK
jgi:hypothetical protein